MTEFVIGIAGCAVGIRSHFEEIKDYCEDYLIDAEPDFVVEASEDEIKAEQTMHDQEHVREGKRVFWVPGAILEFQALYRKIAARLINYNIMLFHGSSVAVDGVAYMFGAKSGVGKSTHASLWRELFGERAVMINDDKPLLKIAEDSVQICGTPWDGKHHLNTNSIVPLKAICFLERSEQNSIRPLTVSQALPLLLQQSHRGQNVAKYMELLDRLTRQVSFYQLSCNMSPDAAKLAYETMRK